MEEPGRLARARDWLDGTTPAAQWLLVFAVLAAIYLPTATWDMRVHVDAAMSAIPAYTLANDGTLELSSVEDLVLNQNVARGQTVEVDGRVYSNRNPGTIFLTYPAYAVRRVLLGPGEFSTGPAAATAALVAAAATATLSLLFRRLGTGTHAVVAGLVAGLATPTWSVSADSTWSHGPTQLWLALAMLATARHAYASSGLAYGAAIFTRPYAAIIAATSGLYESWAKRSWRPVLAVGATSMLGLAAFLVYTRVVFGIWSIYGGYASRGYHANRLSSGASGTFLSDLVLSFVSPTRGLLLFAAFLIPLGFGLRAAWRESDAWVKGAALGGIAYLILQVRAGRYIGGDFFFSYRYQLEMIWMAAPLLFAAWYHRIRHEEILQRVFWALVVAAVALQFLGAAVEVYK